MANSNNGAAVLDAHAKENNIIPLGSIDGAKLLDKIEAFLSRFVSYPSESAKVAHVLWIVHAHLMGLWVNTPRIAFLSPEPGSGKTRALEVTETLVPRAFPQISCSVSFLFRKISDPKGLPTILFDEIDAVFGPKAKENEDLRALLNAGHRRGATVGRCLMRGREIELKEFNCFAPVALAGLGDLPDTILSRSVIVRMRKRAPNEKVESYRSRIHRPAGNALRDQLEVWAGQFRVLPDFPEMPGCIEDRDADVWESLIATADFAGGDWPIRARKAAVSLVTASKETSPSLGVRLLSDLREVFKDHDMTTADILQKLHGIEESPWGDMYGKPLDARRLAKLLHQYGVSSEPIRPDGVKQLKGYTRASLLDPWSRYLPPLPPSGNAVTSVTSVTSEEKGSVTAVTDVTQESEGGGETSLHDAHVTAYLVVGAERI
jgi:hypothetical protein